MCGNHPLNKGGMTSVINQIRDYNWNKEGIELSFIPTFIPGNSIKKIIFFCISYIKILIRFLISKPDIVHMHMSYKGSFSRKYIIHKLCKVFGVKDIIHLHGSEFKKWYDKLDNSKKKKIKKLFTECNEFIVLGRNWEKIIKSISPNVKVTVISNAVKIPTKIACWNNDKFQILYLGVLIPRKGVLDLVDCISLLKNNYKIENFVLVIAGTGEDENKIRKQIRRYGLEKYIVIKGWIEGKEKEHLFQNSQILVLPSYNEGLPISILEGISYGLPVIASNVGDISMAVHNNINGYLIKPGDKEKMADCIISLMSKVTYSRMSLSSRKIAEDQFSEEKMFSNLITLYKKLSDIT